MVGDFQRVRGTYRRTIWQCSTFTSKPLFAIQSTLHIKSTENVFISRITINFYEVFRALAFRILIISINHHRVFRLRSLSCVSSTGDHLNRERLLLHLDDAERGTTESDWSYTRPTLTRHDKQHAISFFTDVHFLSRAWTLNHRCNRRMGDSSILHVTGNVMSTARGEIVRGIQFMHPA